jgi:hypothetical protein
MKHTRSLLGSTKALFSGSVNRANSHLEQDSSDPNRITDIVPAGEPTDGIPCTNSATGCH